MDTSDFYDTAVKALKALDHSATEFDRREAQEDLRDFIRAADEETAHNNSRANWRTHQSENDRKA